MRILAVIWLINISLVFSSSAQHEVVFERISNAQGLNQNSILCLIQDRSGFIWLGTPNGLIKYDGDSYKEYQYEPSDSLSLPSGRIYSLLEDSNENIWLTLDHGIALYNRNENRFYTLHSFNKTLPAGIRIRQVQEVSKGHLLILSNHGIHEIFYSKRQEDASFYEIMRFGYLDLGTNFSNNEQFSTIKRLVGNRWLVVGSNYLYALDIAENSRVKIMAKSNWQDIGFSHVEDIEIIDKQSIWIASNQDLTEIELNEDTYSFDIKKGPFSFPEPCNVSKIIHASNDRIWIGTQDKGLLKYEVKSRIFSQYQYSSEDTKSLGSNQVNDLIIDHTDILWVATAHGGLSKMDPYRKKFINISSKYFDSTSLADNLITGLAVDAAGRLWSGTYNNGLSVTEESLEVSKGEGVRFKSFDKEHSYNCMLALGNYMLLGGTNGVVVYDTRTDQKVSLPSTHQLNIRLRGQFVRCLYLEGQTLWVGTLDGVQRVNINKDDILTGLIQPSDSITHLLDNEIVDVIYKFRGDMWIGTRNGLFRLMKNDNVLDIRHFKSTQPSSQSLGSNQVFSMHEDARGRFWIGTYGGGLHLVQLSEAGEVLGFKRYTKKEGGLSSNVVYRIEEDRDGTLWLSTDGGISRFYPDEEKFENFSMKDGLSSNNFRKEASIFTADGWVVFGGLNGLTLFNPSQVVRNPVPPLPIITELSVLNNPVHSQEMINGWQVLDKPIYKMESIVLPYRLNQISLAFSAMHFSSVKSNTFAYRLRGVDREWVYANHENASASYSQLSPGTYLFELRAFNGDGLESLSTTQLKIMITPPWYRTLWAYLCYGLLLLGMGYLIFLYFERVLLLQRRVAFEQKDKLHQAEINEAKLKFFTNISHEIRTPLTLILSPLERLLHDARLDDALKPLVNNINKNGQRLLNLTNSLIDFRRIGHGQFKLTLGESDIVDIVGKTADAFNDYAQEMKINYNVILPNKEIILSFDKAAIERILFNLLSNAFKYTSDGGKVDMLLEDHKDHIALVIEDSGNGISADQIEFIFDRFFKGDQEETIFGSSGIGLFLVKELTELHKGNVKVRSTEGKGTTFTVFLPKDIAKSKLTDGTPNISTTPEGPKVEGGELLVDQKMILLVEDNKEIRALISQLFEDEYVVIEAENGEEGLEMAKRFIPDLAIIDIMMPKLDGFGLSKSLRDDSHINHIPQVFLTALNDFDSRKAAFEAGADAFVAKPFSPYMLELQVKNILEKRERDAIQIKQHLLMKPEEERVVTKDEIFMTKIKDIVEEKYKDDTFGVDELASETGMSYIQFYRKFKALTGNNANAYLREFRLKKAAHYLKNDENLSASEIMYSVGISSQSYFTKSFKKQFNLTPAEYKKKYAKPSENN
ncbi:ATP-binding protein [Reichenbachiella carrageenanivorans]|uniref:histidine kinase n=1 Tax=Reichenbachiella carrageenanivorans TaxID=2979869 RepID=A0ABY6D2J8_9BACT|nr:two-component regulator propeller domain-containing protein [Reichenbachiella carrageenanivorans]UXX79845.1 ATP-binding protein [Reichenbachiella carrageenanivorans]